MPEERIENMKNIVSYILFLSILVSGIIDVNPTEIHAKTTIDNFDLSIYRADEYLKEGSVCNKIIKNLLKEDTLPSQVIVRDLISKGFMTSVEKWEMAHWLDKSPYEIAQGEVDKKGYYEAILLSIFISESKIDNFLWDMEKTVSAETNLILSSTKSWIKKADEIGMKTLKSNQKISNLSSKQKKELKTHLEELFRKNHPALSKSSDIAEVIDEVFSSVDTVYNAVNKMAYYTNACELSNQTKNLIQLMYQECPQSNCAMKEALRELKVSLDDFNSGVKAEIQSVSIDQASKVISTLVDAGWEKVINANQYVAAFSFGGKFGTKIGDSICNTLFSTDKTIEQYEKMKCLGEFHELLCLSAQKLGKTYMKKRTSVNAKNYFAAIDALFATANLSCKFGVEYADILYQDAALGWTAISNKCYTKFLSDIKSIQKTYAGEQKSLDRNYLSRMKADYPAIYKTIISVQDTDDKASENSANSTSAKVLNQKVHKAYMKQVKADKKNYVYGDGKLKYIFIDLDGDTIDELITYPECNMPDQIIYTYSKGTVRQIDMLNYCRIDVYYESTHITQSTYDNWNIGMKEVSYSRWKNGNNVCIASESCQYMYDYSFVDEPIWHTFINEKEVSKTKYLKYIETLKKGKMIDFSKITWKKY